MTKRIGKECNRKFRILFPTWNFVEFTLVRMTMALINFFPITVSTWTARRIGEAVFLIMPSRRRIAFENLTIAFGNSKPDTEKRRLILESFRHSVTSLMEFFRLPKFAKISAEHIRFKGSEHLDYAFVKGKGVILVMSHLGPWEYLGFLPYLKKYSATVLGRSIRNPYFYQWVKSLRKIVNLKYSDRTISAREIFSELRANHLVAITIDQWAGNEGIWADFFGLPTSTTSLPARLAKRTGSALIPAYCIRVGCGKYEINITPEVSIGENGKNWTETMTKKLNYLLEQQIRAFPDQWMWTHKRWKKR
ncbi:MAG: lysophospholipid acyltransferase family protein [Candidatus Omnitrophota bacterium]|nr:lysophospholipid acyltransferase family protein [Candidatus Omnitrophota bacterium]